MIAALVEWFRDSFVLQIPHMRALFKLPGVVAIDSVSPWQALIEIANRQHGVLGRGQIRELGQTDRFIEHAISSHRLTPIYPGVYAPGHSRLTTQGHWMAAVLACGTVSALSHRSAAANWGLAPPRGVVEILRSSSHAHRQFKYSTRPTRFGRRIKVRRTRWFHPSEFDYPNGIRTTSVARTLLDMSALWNLRQINAALTEAERLKLLRIDSLREAASRGRGWKGIGKLRQALAEWDPQTVFARSDLEIAFLGLCRKHDIATPEINSIVFGMEVDFIWREQRLIVELDGHRYHSAPDVFHRDKERTADLEDRGFRVLRLSHRMVMDDEYKTAQRLKIRLSSGSGSVSPLRRG